MKFRILNEDNRIKSGRSFFPNNDTIESTIEDTEQTQVEEPKTEDKDTNRSKLFSLLPDKINCVFYLYGKTAKVRLECTLVKDKDCPDVINSSCYGVPGGIKQILGSSDWKQSINFSSINLHISYANTNYKPGTFLDDNGNRISCTLIPISPQWQNTVTVVNAVVTLHNGNKKNESLINMDIRTGNNYLAPVVFGSGLRDIELGLTGLIREAAFQCMMLNEIIINNIPYKEEVEG